MDENLSSSPAPFACQVSVQSLDVDTCQPEPASGDIQVSPVLDILQQQAESSSPRREELQVTSQAQDHDQDLQGQGAHGAQRDTGGLQAYLKHPGTSDHAQSTSGPHARGVENTTTENTPASRNPFAKPSLRLFQPVPAIGPHQKGNDSIKWGPRRVSLELSGSQATEDTTSTSGVPNTSAPLRKSLPGSSSLPIQSARETNALLSRPILNKVKKPNISSSSDSVKRPSFDSTKKADLPSSIFGSIAYPNRSLSADSTKAYSHNKSPKSSSSSNKTVQPYKLAGDSSGRSVLFEGNRSYYTPFDPKTSDVNNHSSHRAIDGTMSTGIKRRKSTGRKHLDSSSQPSHLGPAVPFASHTSPLKGAQPTQPASNGDANQPSTQSKGVEPSERALDTSKNIRSSQDSELSEVDSIDPQSFGSTSQSPIRVVADSDDEDNDDGDTDENNDLILYASDNDDESSTIISPEQDNTAQNNKAGADQPASKTSIRNKSLLSTKYTKNSALDDAPYFVCKGDSWANLIQTAYEIG